VKRKSKNNTAQMTTSSNITEGKSFGAFLAKEVLRLTHGIAESGHRK
jgi:hypothetical protein